VSDLIHVSTDRDGRPQEAMCLVCSSIWRRLGLSGYMNGIPFEHFRRTHEKCTQNFADALDGPPVAGGSHHNPKD